MRMRTSVASPCDECGEDAFTGYQGLGWLCSEECFNTAKEKRDAFHDELRALKTEDFPDEFQLSDFERDWVRSQIAQTIKAYAPALYVPV